MGTYKILQSLRSFCILGFISFPLLLVLLFQLGIGFAETLEELDSQELAIAQANRIL
jgi:hypothetical protein